MARRRVILVAAALALCLGPPATTLAQQEEPKKEPTCEEICADLAAQHCDDIDSMECNFFILGCMAGCNYGKSIKER